MHEIDFILWSRSSLSTSWRILLSFHQISSNGHDAYNVFNTNPSELSEITLPLRMIEATPYTNKIRQTSSAKDTNRPLETILFPGVKLFYIRSYSKISAVVNERQCYRFSKGQQNNNYRSSPLGYGLRIVATNVYACRNNAVFWLSVIPLSAWPPVYAIYCVVTLSACNIW